MNKRRYAIWKCDRCNLTLRAKNKTKLARLIEIHIGYHHKNINN